MVPLLEVFLDDMQGQRRVGTARFSLRRGAVSTTFSYDAGYLRHPHSYAIDPAFPLVNGSHHCEGLPGAFRDSAPDRWGRNLIKREHRLAGASGSALRELDEVDYLLGVHDTAREGALRFRCEGGAFLADAAPIPPLVRLPALLAASRRVVEDEAGIDQVKQLIDAGSSSLGGARPKASVVDGERLLLAKFSHPGDDWDVMGWEKTALDVASTAGIAAPARELMRIGDQAVLVLERFDRERSRYGAPRKGYMSAMTLLQAQDGQTRDYAEVFEALAYASDEANEQLEELFRRVAFSVAMHNTDDHLRNYGLVNGGAWTLSPLFDVNPYPFEGKGRATTIMGQDGSRGAASEAEALRELADYAGLRPRRAADIVTAMLGAVGKWREAACRNGCKAEEIRMFEPILKDRQSALAAAFDQ